MTRRTRRSPQNAARSKTCITPAHSVLPSNVSRTGTDLANVAAPSCIVLDSFFELVGFNFGHVCHNIMVDDGGHATGGSPAAWPAPLRFFRAVFPTMQLLSAA